MLPLFGAAGARGGIGTTTDATAGAAAGVRRLGETLWAVADRRLTVVEVLRDRQGVASAGGIHVARDCVLYTIISMLNLCE